jgi:LAO/AO transport system kinase
MNTLLDAALQGDRLSLSRLISMVENGHPETGELMGRVFPRTGKARTIGITGPPGVGKSTLAGAMTAGYRAAGLKVGIVAVDPSSPFSGGAMLGDRLRMQRWATDEGVFIRSLATRGHPGGLSPAARDVTRLLDAAGFEVILVETVGAGQSEVEIMEVVQTVVVVMAPGLGDDIQAQKAGILEIADVLVVNKSDRPDAGNLARQLEAMLDLAPAQPSWRPPVVVAAAQEGKGLEEVIKACGDHWNWLSAGGRLQARLSRRIESEIASLIGRIAAAELVDFAKRAGDWEAVVRAVTERRTEPRVAADQLWEQFCCAGRGNGSPGPRGG